MAIASACNRAPVTEYTSDAFSSTTAEFSTGEPGSNSETASVPDGWPELWYGIYHDAENTRLGESRFKGIHGWPQNVMVLEPGTVTLRGFNYCSGEPVTAATFEVEMEGDAMRLIRPPISGGPVLEGAEFIVIRAGASCGEVVVERRYSSTPPQEVVSTVWTLGELCLTNRCDEVPVDWWTVDLCPDTRTECTE
ncbi:hypothetical protein [Paraliomyxa miuraensis]|uniref:hypothetical protein n=1 Tax=Paraliomyxa miuraensis TaxID=376150 RepID=UPI0022557DCE|nr:hypothetical protein [Paraliomyxa miuraensis]MCX4243485.1 hypothetical protein [Paraliomyxa miuraensis]